MSNCEYLILDTRSPHGQTQWRAYASRRSADRYAAAHGATVVDSRRVGQVYPHPNDAQGWDDLRMRTGCPSRD